MRKVFNSNCIFFILIISTIFIVGNAFSYVVKKGDLLSRVVRTHIPGKVFGKSGTLTKVLKINPQIIDPNIIFPGQNINLQLNRVPTSVALPPENPALVETQKSTKNAFNSDAISFSVTPAYLMTLLSAKDNSNGAAATVAANLHFKVDALYHQNWSEQVHSYVGLTLGYFAAEKPTDSKKSIDSLTKFTSGILLGVNANLSESSQLEGYFNYQKEFFLRGVSSSTITIDTVSVPTMGAKFSYDLFKRSPLTLGVGFEAALKLPASADSYSARLGALYGGKIYLDLDQNRKNHEQFKTSVGFYQRVQNTTLVNQTETNVVLSVQFYFGGGSEN